MSDRDLIALYSGRILELAAAIPLSGSLSAPQGRAKCRSPLCGSSISVDLQQSDGRISAFAQDVRACALGQASAAILGQVVLGQDIHALRRARSALKDMLSAQGAPPEAPFQGYEALLAARNFPNRHASILLALDASIAALEQALSASASA